MKKTPEGIQLSKNEITALLAFSSDEPEQIRYYGVHFVATEEHVKARASNGAIAIDALGPNESGSENEWFVHRDFLRGALKVLDKKCTLTLKFSGASLHEAAVHNEDGIEVSTFSWPHDAANSQTSFADADEFDKLLKPPKGKGVKCVTLNADYLGLMTKVANAAEVYGIDCYPPTGKDGHFMFRCEGADTTWIAMVAPMKSEEETDES